MACIQTLPPERIYRADLSSQQEVRRVASNVLQTLDRLDVLVNNVGGFWMTVSSGAQAMGRK